MTPTELNSLIEQRRSVFQHQYSGEKVDDAIVRQMLLNANWAPTHKFTEPWRFVVYTGEGLKKLARIQAEVYKKVTTTNNTYRDERYQNLLTKPMLSSHIIVIAMKRDPKKSVPEVEEIGAVFCAVQNMHLTAAAYGVGAYLSTGGITYFDESKEAFGFDKDDKIVGFFNIGMLKEKLPVGKRTSAEAKIKWYSE